MRKYHIHLIFLFFLSLLFSPESNAQVMVKKTGDEWRLVVNDQPFEVKGVTFGYDQNVEAYDRYFQDLNFLGVNTIRIWATNENTDKLLDAAHQYGIKVMVGIWMRHGRPGMEDDDHFNYLDDTEGKESMYTNAINVVEQYKNHPAVLTWGIGNEVYLNMATDEEKEAYSKLLEKICSKIKTLDKNHPITSVEAWTFGLKWWQEFVPSIDIYGLNSYGEGAGYLSAELKKNNIDKPYIITEFGVTGEWDIKALKNGIKVEPTDQQKYDAIALGYPDWIKPKPDCLGVYVFHYSSGKNFLSAWLLTHYDTMMRPQYWAIREAFTGKKPLNNVPKIETFELAASESKSEIWIPVSLKISDQENEVLDIGFHYNQRTGSRKRRDQINPLNYRGNTSDGFEIQIPNEDGALKIYVTVRDAYNNVGIASTTIIAKDEKAKERKYLVPKVSLPFYVYNDNNDLPYAPSGYMGNYKSIEVDLNHQEEVHSGNTSIKISYKARNNWYGVGFVNPANDWGDILGGYDLSGAKTFSFWAKANDDNIEATIGFGLIDKDKPFPDTDKKSVKIMLTKKWKQYNIKLKKLDLSCIRSGLVLFSSSNGFPHDIYLDEVVFE